MAIGFVGSAWLGGARVNKVERCRRQSLRRSEVVVCSLDDWFQENSKSAVIDVSGKSTKGARSGLELVSFPQKAVLSIKAIEKEAAELCRDVDLDLDDSAVLALFLIESKFGTLKSSFDAYVQSLPEELDLPICWSQEELMLLQGSAVAEKVQSLRSRILEYSKEILEKSSGRVKQSLTDERFLWAQGILFSRSFDLGPDFPVTLVPVIDSLPFSAAGNCAVQSVRGGLFGQEKRVALVAEADVESNDQVVLTRRSENNAQYLIDFGMAFDKRPDLNTVEIVFGVSSMDPFYDDKVNILEMQGMTVAVTFSISAGVKEGREEDLLTLVDVAHFLRLVCLETSDAFLLEAVFRSDVWEFMSEPVSPQNEEAMCQTIIAACEAQLDGYNEPGTEVASTSRGSLAQIVVNGERTALEGIIEYFQRELKLLDSKEYYQERRLRELDMLRPVDASEIVPSDSAERAANAFDDYY